MDTKQGDVVVSTADLRKNLGDVIARAHYQDQVVGISNHGKLHAAVVSGEDAEFLKRIKKSKGGSLKAWQNGELVSKEDAELIKALKGAAGGNLEEWKKGFNKVANKEIGLEELVRELERSEPAAPKMAGTQSTARRSAA